MSLSLGSLLSSRTGAVDDPTTMPLPGEPLAWRRWADAMPDICLWIAPHSGRIVDCNRALFGILGYSRTEVFGWPLQALAEPRHLVAGAATWRTLAACQALQDADCTLRARDGHEVAASATASPVLNEEGRLVAGLVVLRDITERRRREQAQQARKRELKTLAYELTVAEGRARARIGERLASQSLPLLSLARATVQQLRQAAGRAGAASYEQLEEMLSQSLQASEAAIADLAWPGVPGGGLQAAIEQIVQQINRDTGMVARIEGQLPEALALAGPVQAVLLRVLRELAGNAVRHARARHLWIRLQAESDRLCIVAGDDGTGFDMSRLSRQLARETPAEAGTGLITAEGQMQAVGGRLVVQSKPGRGTRAMLVLPLPAAPAPDTR